MPGKVLEVKVEVGSKVSLFTTCSPLLKPMERRGGIVRGRQRYRGCCKRTRSGPQICRWRGGRKTSHIYN